MNSLDYRGSLADVDAVARAIQTAGASSETARRKSRLLARCHEALAGARRSKPLAFLVPGRVEVLGKHTDYAGGRSMVIAAEQGFAVVCVPRSDRRVVVRAVDAVDSIEFPLDADLSPRLGHWSNYPMTVARRVARNFPGPLVGAEVAFASDLPTAAGMSSSSALVVSVYLVLAAVNQLADRAEYRENIKTTTDLAGYLGCVENGQTFGSLVGDRGVGTFGGSEDHTAILCGRPGRVSQYAYCPVRFERDVAIPPTHAFAIASSGVVAEKTGGALEQYNAASRGAARLAELWRASTGRDDPHLAAILATSPDAAEKLREIVGCVLARTDETRGDSESTHVESEERDEIAVRATTHPARGLLARLDHFILENNEIIPRAGDALATGNLSAFGAEVDRSQSGAERLLGNQVPETIFLAASARRLGADAASAFGAGFGGSVWALVERSRLDPFLAAWQAAYAHEFPGRADTARFFPTAAGMPAMRLS